MKTFYVIILVLLCVGCYKDYTPKRTKTKEIQFSVTRQYVSQTYGFGYVTRGSCLYDTRNEEYGYRVEAKYAHAVVVRYCTKKDIKETVQEITNTLCPQPDDVCKEYTKTIYCE